MTSSFSRLLCGVLLLGLGASCGNTAVSAKLFRDPSCDEAALRAINSLGIFIQGPTKRFVCFDLDGPKPTMSGLERAINAEGVFLDLPGGDYDLKIKGFGELGCVDSAVNFCGETPFALPPVDEPLTIPVVCHEGANPPAAFTDCAGS